ncbi:MAG TPA: hypothetical protein VII45_06015 [Solirubrobacterales bacterium]
MNRPLRFTLVWASILATFGVLAPFALAGARTYYASPAGVETACTQALPCNLNKAVEETLNEDSVVLAPGTYVLPGGGLGITKEIDIGGQVGAAATTVIDTTGGSVHVGVGAKSTLHDMRMEGPNGLILSSGSADRLFVSYTGSSSSGCSLAVATTMRDSVCWSHNPSSNAGAIDAATSGGEGTVALRNVTAIATSGGDAIHASASGSPSKLLVEGANVIARAAHHPDVEVERSGGGLPVVEVKLANSNFATVSGEEFPLATMTAPGTNGNQIAAPSFVGATTGDFREAPGSATIDAGLTDPLNGSLDLAGSPRVAPVTCAGGSLATDIGAYEFSPSATCPVPLVVSIPPEIKIGKLKLNKKKGTGTLFVTVSGPGNLTLSGKGIKKLSRSSHGSEVLKLAVRPVGMVKKSLAESGRAKLSLKLKFVSTGGAVATKAKKVNLIQKGS